MGADEISQLVEFADHLVYEKTRKHLETVEKDLLRQTFAGKKLKDIQSESYSNSYIQRYVAPQLWKRLSDLTGEKVTKTTVREVLKQLQSQRAVASTSVESIPTQATTNTSETENPPSDRTESNSSVAPPLPSPPPPGNPPDDWLPQFIKFINFIKPGVPLCLCLGIVGTTVGLSRLANWCGVTNHLAGFLPKAQFCYAKAIQLNPDSGIAHYNLGVLYEDQQNFDLARSQYQKAIQDGFVAAAAYNNLGRLYILDNDYTAAVNLLSNGMKLAKDTEDKYSLLKNLGWARLKQSRYAQAKVHLQEAIDLDHEKAPAHCLMAQLLETQPNQTESLKHWESCLAYASSDNPDQDIWIGMAQQRLKATRTRS